LNRAKWLSNWKLTSATQNPMGTLHGGILCDIADAAMGIAHASLLQRAKLSPRLN